MNLSEWALRYPLAIGILLVMLVVLGAQSYWTMPRSEDPQFEFAAALVRVVKTGTSVEDMESLIVEPIEEALYEIDDIKHIKTNIQTGVVSFEVEFIYGSDADDKYDEVVAAVERTRALLPTPLQLLDVEPVSPQDVSVMQIGVTSLIDPLYQLRIQADVLEQAIERLPGVKRVDIQAAPQQQVRVTADLLKLHAAKLTGLELVQSINQSADNEPLGYGHLLNERLNLKGSGDFPDLTALAATFIQPAAKSNLQVQQVAQVAIADPEPSYRAYLDGQPAIWLSVIQRKGTQIDQVLAGVDQVLAQQTALMPTTTQVRIIHDQRISTSLRISGFFNNLFQGLLLVFIATAAFLGFANAAIVTALIPISICMALGWLDLLGFGIQQMSIVGLVIALGLLVDNALVVIESVNHRRLQGLPAKAAAMMGTKSVSWPIIAGTLTTVLAFVPLLALPNNAGTFMRSMPVMVVLTLIASLLTALTLAPILASRFYSNKTPVLYLWLQQLVSNLYRPLLIKCLKFPKKCLALAIVIWALSLCLFPILGVSLFPKAEKHMVSVYLEKVPGTSFDRMRDQALTMAAQLRTEPNVIEVALNVGRENPRVYYNVFPSRQVPHLAHLLVFFDHNRTFAEVQAQIAQWRQRYLDEPGLKVRIREFQQGPPTVAPLAIRLISEDIDLLKQAAARVETLMSEHPGVLNLENPMSERTVDLRVHILRDRAAQWGVPLQRIDETVKLATQGVHAGLFQDANGDDMPISIRLDRQWSLQQQLNLLHVRGAHQQSYPLSALVELRLEGSLTRLQHYNLSRMARLTADIAEGFNVRQTTEELLDQINTLELKGVQVEVGGDEASRKESFAGMSQALTFALLGVLSILVLQFRSLTQPVIILTATPFAMTGALVGLWLIGSSFSFTAFIGLTALVGIVVNNAILLIDAANKKIHKGFSVSDAVVAAGEQRFIPILLTTLTTLLGLLPLTLSNSSLWTPMGTVIIGGLSVSTLLTLFVVPILYTLVGGHQAHVRQEPAINLPELEPDQK